MVRVMAQGTFDIIHPGHLHYLRESAALGDELVVVIGRDEKMRQRKDLFFDHDTRRDIVAALEMVDEAQVGLEGDIYKILDVVEPDVVTLGYDQDLDVEHVREKYRELGHEDIDLERMSKYEPREDEIVSSSEIKRRLKDRHGESAFHSIVE